jgi:hypothetical protein
MLPIRLRLELGPGLLDGQPQRLVYPVPTTVTTIGQLVQQVSLIMCPMHCKASLHNRLLSGYAYTHRSSVTCTCQPLQVLSTACTCSFQAGLLSCLQRQSKAASETVTMCCCCTAFRLSLCRLRDGDNSNTSSRNTWCQLLHHSGSPHTQEPSIKLTARRCPCLLPNVYASILLQHLMQSLVSSGSSSW